MNRRLVIVVVMCAWLAIAAASLSPPCSAQTSATWTPTGDLNVGRIYHTATLLRDGRVLVVGGRRNCCSPELDSAEIWDPATGAWTLTGPVGTALAGHVATRLADGRVLVIGGDGSVAQLFDPATEQWSTTDAPGARYGFSITLLPSGNVLIAGGCGAAFSALASARIYDTSTGKWRDTAPLHDKRCGHASALLADGQVLVAGGGIPIDIENSTLVATAELFDPATETWLYTASPGRQYSLPSMIALSSGRALVLGDVGDTEQYDPVTERWTITGTRSSELGDSAFALLAGDQVIVTGGNDSRTGTLYLASAQLYDAATGAWQPTTPLSTARRLHTATTLADGRVLVTGGVGASGRNEITLRKSEIYQPSATIGPGYTGAWFDPAQSGHGLFIEVLPGARILVAWFTFDPAGNPAWFLGTGTYSGDTATVASVDQPSGGRWIPNFDASRIVHHAWGSLTLTFTDCNHGSVAFDSVAGYGRGNMPLVRLTLPDGLTCL